LAGGTLTGGLSFGAVVASSAIDLSKHIRLYTSEYGFSVTGGSLNAVANGNISFYPNVVNTRIARITSAGLVMDASDVVLSRDPSLPLHAASKQYADKMLPLAGGKMTGKLTVDSANVQITINGAAADYKTLQFNAANKARMIFQIGPDGAGGNVGGDLVINRCDDAGAFLGSRFTYRRSDGKVTLGGGLEIRGSNIAIYNGATYSGQVLTDANWGVMVQGFAGAIADAALLNRSAKGIKVNSNSVIDLNGATIDSVGLTTIPRGLWLNGPHDADATKFANHLTLSTNWGGIGVTNGQFNFIAGNTLIFSINPTTLFIAGGKQLLLGRDPVAAMDAATKQYVDAKPVGIDQATADANYVNVTGDQMSGSLVIAPTAGWPSLVLKKTDLTGAQLIGEQNGTTRWSLQLGNGATETAGGNTGSDFAISRFDNAGAYIDAPVIIDRATGGMSINTGLAANGAVSINNILTAGGEATFNNGANVYNYKEFRLGFNAAQHWKFDLENGSWLRIRELIGGVTHDRLKYDLVAALSFRNYAGPMAGFGAYRDTSDIRYKTNVASATVGLAEVLQLEPINFNRIDGTGEVLADEIGFSAQQVQPIIPEATPIFSEMLPDGLGGETSALSLVTTPIIAALVNAVKELTQRLTALEAV
jgi:hypothetical protein